MISFQDFRIRKKTILKDDARDLPFRIKERERSGLISGGLIPARY
jgi:hypothetical protein